MEIIENKTTNEINTNLSIVDLIKQNLANKKMREVQSKIDEWAEKAESLLNNRLQFYIELSEFLPDPKDLKDIIDFLESSSLAVILQNYPKEDRKSLQSLTNIK